MTSADVELVAGSLDAPLAWRHGLVLSRRQFIADAAALAERLPAGADLLNLSVDRYRFAVGFAAGLLRGVTSLLPPNQTADTVDRLRRRFDRMVALVETGGDSHGLPSLRHADDAADPTTVDASPRIAADHVAAFVLTSGSTGDPVPHPKPWGLLARNARAEASRLAEMLGRADLAGLALVATVPPQHMYGFESSVLIAMHGGAAFDADRPFYPADVVAALDRVPRPRMLVTTPFHLKTCLEARLPMPAADLVLCATAPLAPQLAAAAERAFGAPLVEIYGCTEAGQVASRRTTAGPEWQTLDALRIAGDGSEAVVSGGHVVAPVQLADVLDVVDAQTFRLLGRSNDLINIAGKRSSLGHLDFHLNQIEGVVDGAFWMPPDDGHGSVVRLVAVVVAPEMPAATLLAALRERLDPAFLPRRIVHVESLPREATGKLTAARLAAFAAERLSRRDAS